MTTAFWDDRYSDTDYVYGIEPNDFLAAEAHRLPKGRVLCLAEGQGRNATYLAALGFTVTAVDQSAVGLTKAQELAAQSGVQIETIQADLAQFMIEPASWDGIVSIFAHTPPPLRHRIHHQVEQGLKPGGLFILEAYTKRHLEMEGIGGPPSHMAEMLMSLADLQQELEGLTILIGQEIERVVNEGKYHQGNSAVVQIVAAKI